MLLDQVLRIKKNESISNLTKFFKIGIGSHEEELVISVWAYE